MSKTIVLASDNQGKIQEIEQMLANLMIIIKPQSAFNVPCAEETGTTFVENAIIKARNACLHSNLPSIADDSGIEVDALQGKPGVFSARYAGEPSNAENNIDQLLADLANIPPEKRRARFQCVLVYLQHALDPTPIIAQASWEGLILPARQGKQGHGYDPVFYCPEHQCSAAELTMAQKNNISHRGKALQQFVQLFKARQ